MASVLIVEPDDDVRLLLEVTLRRHRTVAVPTGGDARAELDAAPPEALVIEPELPDDDGLQLVRDVRRDAIVSNIPIVGVSVGASPDEALDAYRAGVDIYVVKPFSPDELADVVDRLLERTSEQRRRERERRILDVRDWDRHLP